MFKLILSCLLASFACAGSLFAQLPQVVAVDELSSDESLIPFRKLLSEYSVTELASVDRVTVIGYDKVNSVKQDLGLASLQGADRKDIDKVCSKLGAEFICVGKVDRDAAGKILATVSVFKAGDKDAPSVSAALNGIEDSDDTAKNLAAQIGKIIKNWGVVSPGAQTAAPPAGAKAPEAK